jgi:hypothetical protein|tara:strand:- start:201 stop:470 length:270 start_codon:yes stop_codon:yes gene_type:complete
MRELIPLTYQFDHSLVIDPFKMTLSILNQFTEENRLACEQTFITHLEKSLIEHGTCMQERQVVSAVGCKYRVGKINAGTGEKMTLDFIA